MTKKHFIKIAAAFNTEYTSPWRNESERYMLSRLAHQITDAAQEDNPRFDRKRFLKACGIEQ
jgi:hypothetical protein